ncbi:MAG TPA: SGNH/GDSL hydrolase family protein [Pyrinomonadaceae bacterium]|nr:SGNH/GDSL hydrolase family protein [Pyrinomonadaceae bacterium]
MDDQEQLTDNARAPAQKRRISFRRRLAYIAFVYLIFVLILVAVEVFTRLKMPHVSSLDLFVVTSQQKAQVADNEHVGIFEGDPLLLWRLKPNLDNVYWDYTVVSTNSDHLRVVNPSQSVQGKRAGTIRILCLGDSVTFGYRVPPVWPDKLNDYDREWLPYPRLLEKQLSTANPGRKVEVITMAVPGYTSHQGLAWLSRDIDWLQPDLLIVSFGWNDTSFSDVPDREAIKTNRMAVAVRWLIDHSQAFAHATHWLRNRELKNQPAGTGVRQPPVARVSQEEYLQNMIAIEELTRMHGAQVIVIGAPYRDTSPSAPEGPSMLRYRQALSAAMSQAGVPYLEILELTEAAYPANEGWFGERIHPNHMGHRLMTSELLKLIAAKRLLPELMIPEFVP